jgi:hypothetical protein
MKPFTRVLPLAFCIFASPFLRGQDAGQQPPGPGPGRGGGGPIPPESALVERFDKDHDGRLDRDERQAARDAVRKERSEGGGRRFGPPGGRGNREPPKPGPRIAVSDARAYPDSQLYDPAALRTLFFEIDDADWEKELADFYRTDVDVPAALTVDGRKIEGVGLHFRGASSFFTVGEGWKRSINVALDHTHPGEKLHGYKTLELLNSHEDPTFARTFLFNFIARHYIPAAKVNHVKVAINGESWGIYVSQEQFNKDFLKEWFGTKDGARWRMPANPRGGNGLGYVGDDPAEYKRRYEHKSGGGDKPWKELIQLCRTLGETPPARLEEELEPILNIDRALWFLALDNALINDDGYWIRASDFNLYQDRTGRFHTLPHDANETFQLPGGPGFGRGPEISGVELDPLFGADDPQKPLLNRLLAAPTLRARYLAHVRTIAEEWLDWGKLGPIVEKLEALISSEVNADARKLSSFESFQKGFKEDHEEESFRGRRRVISLKSFVEERGKYLLGHPEIKKPVARFASVSRQITRDGLALPADPTSRDPVLITAEIAGDVQPERVLLHYADAKRSPFKRLEMTKGSNGRYAATLPPLPAGTRVRYYLEARSAAAGATTFLPARTEMDPLEYRVRKG